MDERLKKQMEFAMEIDKEKTYSGRPIFPVVEEMKMMQNMHGTWQVWNDIYRDWICEGIIIWDQFL